MTEPKSAAAYPAPFLRAAERVLGHEGGYVNDPYDPGGETKFGISKRQHPSLDIRNLTRAGAIEIYYRDYWRPGRYAELPAPVAVKLFDLAVNLGPAHAARCLQRALRAAGHRVADDGALGPQTAAAARAAEPAALMAALRSEAAGYYRALAARDGRDRQFLDGWLNRAYE